MTRLNQLTQEIRVNQQIHKGQQTFEKELSNWLKQSEKLMKDSASLYPQEALQNIVEDVQEVVAKVSEDYDNLAKSSRFLTGSEEELPSPAPVPVDILPEPVKNQDGTLTKTGVEEVIETLDEPVIAKLATIAGIRSQKKTTIAKNLALLHLTETALLGMIETAKSLIPRPLRGNQLTIIAED